MANVRPASLVSTFSLTRRNGRSRTVDAGIRAELHHSSRGVVRLCELEAGFGEAVDRCRAQDLCLDEPGCLVSSPARTLLVDLPGSNIVRSHPMLVFCPSQVSHHASHTPFAEAILDASSQIQVASQTSLQNQ